MEIITSDRGKKNGYLSKPGIFSTDLNVHADLSFLSVLSAKHRSSWGHVPKPTWRRFMPSKRHCRRAHNRWESHTHSKIRAHTVEHAPSVLELLQSCCIYCCRWPHVSPYLGLVASCQRCDVPANHRRSNGGPS